MNNMDLTSKRKDILFRIDNEQEVSNLEKGFLGLTTYYDIDKNDILSLGIYEKVLDIKNKSNPIKHLEEEYYFMPEQVRIYNELLVNNRILLSAPTSFGKSLLMKEYIYNEKPNFVVYIVPTNSLAYELEQDYKNNKKFEDYDIFDSWKTVEVDEEENNKYIFIGTQEKYSEVFSNLNINIDIFIIDEAYKLQESSDNKRSYILSNSFLKAISLETNKIFLLSPNGKFKGFEYFDFKIIDVQFNCVEKNFIELKEEEYIDRLKEEYSKNKTLLFCKTPKQIAENYQLLCLEEVEIKKDLEIKKGLEKIIKELEEEIHPEWVVVKYLKKNILVHHGQMPKYLQNKVIRLFNNKELSYNLLIGTKSVSEGINTPTKSIFIDKLYRLDDRDRLLIKNTIGRAGRLKQYPIGNVFSLKQIDDTKRIDNFIKDIEIRLSLSDENEKENFDDEKIDKEISEIVNTESKEENKELEKDLIKKILKKHNIKVNVYKRFIEELKKDRKYPGYTTLVYISNNVLKGDYKCDFNDDEIYLKGLLRQDDYQGTFDAKINFYKSEKKKQYEKKIVEFQMEFNQSVEEKDIRRVEKKINTKINKIKELEKITSYIIDGYMKMQYSTLEYTYLPLVNLYFELIENNVTLNIGKNVHDTFEDFRRRYNIKIRNFSNYDKLSDNEKRIFDRLRDLGINISKMKINEYMIKEIENTLNIRYSMYDIEKVIRRLGNTSVYSKQYKEIVEKYFN